MKIRSRDKPNAQGVISFKARHAKRSRKQRNWLGFIALAEFIYIVYTLI